jgi:hypothetical protein
MLRVRDSAFESPILDIQTLADNTEKRTVIQVKRSIVCYGLVPFVLFMAITSASGAFDHGS